MYIKLTGGQPLPYSVERLRRDNPQVSFPETIPAARLADYDVYEVTSAPQPSVDHTKNVTEAPPQQIGGAWTQVWRVTDASAREIADRTAAQAANMRAKRNARLAACDWTQLVDAPVDGVAWGVYRQALRDISAQQGFPWNVTWPANP